MFKSLDAAILYVKNIKTAKKFYLTQLGFCIDYDDGQYVALKANKNDSVRIALNSEGKKGQFPGHQTIVLKTVNLKKTYLNLKNRNVDFLLDLTKTSWGETFTVIDPDGNKIEVI